MHPDNFSGNNPMFQPGPTVPGRTDQTKKRGLMSSLINLVIFTFTFFVTLPWIYGAYKEIKEQDKRYEKISQLSHEPKSSRE